MKRTRQAAIILSLALIFFISLKFILFTSFLNSQKTYLRHSAIITSSEIKHLKIKAGKLYIDRAGIEWKENNKEVVLNGNYYEVLCISHSGDIATVTIISDDEENRLLAGFFNSSSRGGKLKELYYYFLSLYFQGIEEPITSLHYYNTVNYKYIKIGTLDGFLTCLQRPPSNESRLS
jgi:hypothetical protein